MVRDAPTRLMIRELERAGWSVRRADGRHSVYGCRCGRHTFALPTTHRMVSAGVVAKARRALAECEGSET